MGCRFTYGDYKLCFISFVVFLDVAFESFVIKACPKLAIDFEKNHSTQDSRVVPHRGTN